MHRYWLRVLPCVLRDDGVGRIRVAQPPQRLHWPFEDAPASETGAAVVTRHSKSKTLSKERFGRNNEQQLNRLSPQYELVNQLQSLYIAGLVFGQASQEVTIDLHTKTRSGMMHRDTCRSTPDNVMATAPRREVLAATTSMMMKGKATAEKLALLRYLATIQRTTGWKTSDRARDMRVLWGLELGEENWASCLYGNRISVFVSVASSCPLGWLGGLGPDL